MPFPSVADSATTDGTTATATPVVNLPSSITSGNTLVLLFRSATGGVIDFPAGWIELYNLDGDYSNDQTGIAWKKADGTEGPTVTLGSGDARFAAIVWEISEAGDPTIQAPEISILQVGRAQQVKPKEVTPTGGSKDYLFLWLGGWEGKQDSPPIGSPGPLQVYSDPIGASTGGAGNAQSNCRVAGAWRQLTVSSHQGGLWTLSRQDDSSTWTMAIHPVRRIFTVIG